MRRAHEMECNAMHVHLSKLQEEAARRKQREQGAQTTLIPTKYQNKGAGVAPSSSLEHTDGHDDYSADFEPAASTTTKHSPRQQNNQSLLDSIAEENMLNNFDDSIGGGVNNTSTEDIIHESIADGGDSYNDDDFETSIIDEISMRKDPTPKKTTTTITGSTTGYNVDKERSVEKKKKKVLESLIVDSSTSNSSNSNSSYSTPDDDSYEDNDDVPSTLERRTGRLMKKIISDLETRQRHEDQLFDLKEDRIKDTFSNKLKLLVNKRKSNELSKEHFERAKDMCTLVYKSSMAEVEKERGSLHAKHYREIVKLQRRHSTDTENMPTLLHRGGRRKTSSKNTVSSPLSSTTSNIARKGKSPPSSITTTTKNTPTPKHKLHQWVKDQWKKIWLGT